MPKSKSDAELRAMAFDLSDEIETRALPYMQAGLTRTQAINKAIRVMATQEIAR
jgi:hypothetical protein